jgi:hypothetical protein
LNTESAAAIAAAILNPPARGNEQPYQATRVLGGANNRVFKIESAGENYLLKSYFQSAPGARDRLASDYGFCRFAWEAGVRALPQPIAADERARVAIYEFVEGRRLGAGEVGQQAVDAAIQFIVELNRLRDREDARQLPPAAEACFSISEHLDRVDERVNRLLTIDETQPLGERAAGFARSELLPKWRGILHEVGAAAADLPAEASLPLPLAIRCLSPSDFGFHNALLQENGQFRFFDFEYAGWDDPAKLICDFFCQPEVPVPIEFLGRFGDLALQEFPSREGIVTRAHLLLPVYRIKWCCIMLNEFLAVENKRRRFADPASSDYERKERQLNRVLVLFQQHFAGRS